MILTSGTEQYLITWKNKKYIFLLTTTLTISDMDLHNNEVGRAIGENNSGSSEDEKADIIYQDIYFEETQFIWLHD